MIKERLRQLREKMEERGIDIYIVPTSDFHESEYVGEHFKARKFITGFTGSAGTAVVTKTEAGLWTDGRYFIQAEAQLEGSTVKLYKMGIEGVPTVTEFVKDKMEHNGCIGFDGRVINGKLGSQFQDIIEKKNGRLFVEEDLIDMIWEERPQLPKEKAFMLEEKYAGKSVIEKLSLVREKMKEAGANVHIITSLDDIAWLLNMRGGDISHFPVVLSFAVVTMDSCHWFLNEEVLNDNVKQYLEKNQIEVLDYNEIYSFVASLDETSIVLMDKSCVNFRICHSLNENIKVVDKKNPTHLMKAIKNPIEIENVRKAHLKDGVAFTKFMYWLKNNIGKIEITEISASDYLEARRREQEGFIDLSFDTISAYGANAAMMHYSATKETNAILQTKSFLLVDSGGHYYEGSTDITRTMALGELTEEEKLYFTTVARSNLNLAAAKFLYGCSGLNLDILSRGPLWEMGMDYRCGTGHGIGYLLNVHEGPNGFRWKVVPERNDSGILEAGMITTDEPGVYIEGKFGIRTENELICYEAEKNEYGQFMAFENVTYAPIDLDAIIPEEMTKREKKLLNDYHKMVYEKLSPYMTEEENMWLKHYTREI